MNSKTFDRVVERRIGLIREVLQSKASEYANNGDRLHNFRIVSGLNGTTAEAACWWLNCKHLVSIRDMVLSGKEFPLSQWDEKIGDAINYLILLEAIVQERANAALDRNLENPPPIQENHLELA